MVTTTPELEEYWAALAQAVPEFTPEEQRAAVGLYRELARGAAVTVERLGKSLKVPLAEAEELLGRPSIRSLTYRDAQGALVGFGGLAVAPMHHKFEVDGRTLWTWCAWDSLFIPEILGQRAAVESPDPETEQPVRLVVTPDRIESADPEGAVVSFLLPDAHAFGQSAANAMASFCHFVFFFGSRDSGERWVTRHPGTFVYPLSVAFELARRLNRTRFGSIVAG